MGLTGRKAGLVLVSAEVPESVDCTILEQRQTGVVHEHVDTGVDRSRKSRGLSSTVPDGYRERRAVLGDGLLDQLDHVRTDVVVVRQRDPGEVAACSLDRRTRGVGAVLHNAKERVGTTDSADLALTGAAGLATLGDIDLLGVIAVIGGSVIGGSVIGGSVIAVIGSSAVGHSVTGVRCAVVGGAVIPAGTSQQHNRCHDRQQLEKGGGCRQAAALHRDH